MSLAQKITTIEDFIDVVRALRHHETIAVIITAPVCREILARFNLQNRKIKPRRLAKMARVMDRWLAQIVEMGIDDAGLLVLLDGQHRLKVCAESGEPLHEILRVSLGDIECARVRDYKDTELRTFADRLAITRNLKAPARVAHVLQLIAQVKKQRLPCELTPDDEQWLVGRYLQSALFAMPHVSGRQAIAALAMVHADFGPAVGAPAVLDLLNEHAAIRGRGAAYPTEQLYNKIGQIMAARATEASHYDAE